MSTVDAYNQSAWSPKAGLVYQIIKDKFSIFGNYQNSFKSNGYFTTDISGSTALSDPEKPTSLKEASRPILLMERLMLL